jgi:hypothetical protein
MNPNAPLPSLAEHPAFAELSAKRDKLAAELADLDRERAALGDVGPPLVPAELDALRIVAGKTNPDLVKRQKAAEKAHELDYRADVLRRALKLLDPELEAARQTARRELCKRVFDSHYRPAVREAGEKLLAALAALWALRKLHGEIASADLEALPKPTRVRCRHATSGSR